MNLEDLAQKKVSHLNSYMLLRDVTYHTTAYIVLDDLVRERPDIAVARKVVAPSQQWLPCEEDGPVSWAIDVRPVERSTIPGNLLGTLKPLADVLQVNPSQYRILVRRYQVDVWQLAQKQMVSHILVGLQSTESGLTKSPLTEELGSAWAAC